MSKRRRESNHYDRSPSNRQDFSSPTKRRSDLVPLTALLAMIDKLIEDMEKKEALSGQSSTGSHDIDASPTFTGTQSNHTNIIINDGDKTTTEQNGGTPDYQVEYIPRPPNDSQSFQDGKSGPGQRQHMTNGTKHGTNSLPQTQDNQVPQANGINNHVDTEQNGSSPREEHAKVPDEQVEMDDSDGGVKIKTERIELSFQNNQDGIKRESKEDIRRNIKLELKQEHSDAMSNNGVKVENQEQPNDLITHNQRPAAGDEQPSVEHAVSRLLREHILVKFD
jgi:hypothetical protein